MFSVLHAQQRPTVCELSQRSPKRLEILTISVTLRGVRQCVSQTVSNPTN